MGVSRMWASRPPPRRYASGRGRDLFFKSGVLTEDSPLLKGQQQQQLDHHGNQIVSGRLSCPVEITNVAPTRVSIMPLQLSQSNSGSVDFRASWNTSSSKPTPSSRPSATAKQ